MSRSGDFQTDDNDDDKDTKQITLSLVHACRVITLRGP